MLKYQYAVEHCVVPVKIGVYFGTEAAKIYNISTLLCPSEFFDRVCSSYSAGNVDTNAEHLKIENSTEEEAVRQAKKRRAKAVLIVFPYAGCIEPCKCYPATYITDIQLKKEKR
jgi:hypothetical protein